MRNPQVSGRVRYDGDLPDGWGRFGTITAVQQDASGDQIATVEFGPGQRQDIPASELARDLLPRASDDTGKDYPVTNDDSTYY